MLRYGYQRESTGYSVWALGLSGTRQDCIGWVRDRRAAERLINRLYRKGGR